MWRPFQKLLAIYLVLDHTDLRRIKAMKLEPCVCRGKPPFHRGPGRCGGKDTSRNQCGQVLVSNSYS